MGDRKTIQINPDLFKFSDSTRKKREKTQKRGENPEIKMKTTLSKVKNKTLRKNILKMIREKQQDEYKQLFQDSSKPTNAPPQSDSRDSFKKDFNESLDYFSSLVESAETKKADLNKTMKQYPNTTTESLLYHPSMAIDSNVNVQLPDVFNQGTSSSVLSSEEFMQLRPSPIISRQQSLPPPQYGCLKNGRLPTYRIFKNNTMKNMPSIGGAPQNNLSRPSHISTHDQMSNHGQMSTPGQMSNHGHISTPGQMSTPVHISTHGQISTPVHISTHGQMSTNGQISTPVHISNPNSQIRNEPTKVDDWRNIQERRTRAIELSQLSNKIKTIHPPNPFKRMKQKKIFRRTYRVGKSKYYPKVAVLVSNRTVRNRISTKSQLLKQTSIQDVKKSLLKRGLIKVGTLAPNDVLRKMYESVELICGEVQNHNADNLLHNFIHDK